MIRVKVEMRFSAAFQEEFKVLHQRQAARQTEGVKTEQKNKKKRKREEEAEEEER